MVSEEDGQAVKTPEEEKKLPQGDPGLEKKEETTGEKKRKGDLKPGEQVAFPLGSTRPPPEEEKKPPPEDKNPPPEKGEAKQDINNPLEGGQNPPPEKREDVMVLDDETKRFIGEGLKEEVKSQTDPLKQELSTVRGEMKTGIDKLEKVIGELNKTPPGPQVKMPTVQEVIEGTKKAIKSEEDERRKRLENDQRTKDREEKLKKLDDVCLNDPDCFKKRLDEQEKKISQLAEEKKTETPAGPQPLEPMTEEKRKTWTEEQNRARDAEVDKRIDPTGATDNDLYRRVAKSKANITNIAKKTEMRGEVFDTITDKERKKIVLFSCKNGVCKPFREGMVKEEGVKFYLKDERGKFKPVDEPEEKPPVF